MESIRQAVERARSRSAAVPAKPGRNGSGAQIQETVLDGAHLQSNRIISHDITDRRSRSFDMLRTQVLQSMDLKGWRTLAVTSPTPGLRKNYDSSELGTQHRAPARKIGVVGGFGLSKAPGGGFPGTKV